MLIHFNGWKSNLSTVQYLWHCSTVALAFIGIICVSHIEMNSYLDFLGEVHIVWSSKNFTQKLYCESGLDHQEEVGEGVILLPPSHPTDTGVSWDTPQRHTVCECVCMPVYHGYGIDNNGRYHATDQRLDAEKDWKWGMEMKEEKRQEKLEVGKNKALKVVNI